MDTLLVDGYIRDIEKTLKTQIIPSDIIHLISSYYCMLIRLLCLHRGIHIADVNNRHPMKSISWKCKIISLKDNKQTQLAEWGISTAGPGICSATHIEIPSNIKQQISDITKNTINNHKYDVVFKCGGGYYINASSSRCSSSAVIFDRKQFETIPDGFTVSAFKWKLPSLPANLYCSDAAFSKDFGLITLGCTKENETRFYKLKFNSHEYIQQFNWKWNRLNNLPTQSIAKHSCLTFDNQFVIMSDTNIAMYNLERDEWRDNLSKATHSRNKCGMLYDYISGMIYIGGGPSTQAPGGAYQIYDNYNSLSCNIEYYNIVKNKWFNDLPETWMAHANYPILWKDHTILYIASAWNDGAEYLDLRENAKMWTRVYVNNIQSLSHVFGAQIALRQGHFRLVC